MKSFVAPRVSDCVSKIRNNLGHAVDLIVVRYVRKRAGLVEKLVEERCPSLA